MTVAQRLDEWLPFLWFLLATLVLAALWTSGILPRLVDRVTKFGGFGLSFEFTEKSARETRESVEKGLGEIRSAIQRKLANDVRATGLQHGFRALVDATDLKDMKGYRATIHIPDPLFANQLFQLLDYVPNGRGSGRAFSSRSGIIGLAWRNLDTQRWHQHSEITEENLRYRWGMTDEEAEARATTDRSKLFLAVTLRDLSDAVPIGVFYLDARSREGLGLPPAPDPSSPDEDAIADAKQAADDLLDRIEQQVRQQFNMKLAEPLAKLVGEARAQGPLINLEGER